MIRPTKKNDNYLEITTTYNEIFIATRIHIIRSVTPIACAYG